jgi:hypothetical protein
LRTLPLRQQSGPDWEEWYHLPLLAKECATRGYVFLSNDHPDALRHIEVRNLDLASCTKCVLGQGFEDAAIEQFGFVADASHGFINSGQMVNIIDQDGSLIGQRVPSGYTWAVWSLYDPRGRPLHENDVFYGFESGLMPGVDEYDEYDEDDDDQRTNYADLTTAWRFLITYGVPE